MQSTGHSSMQDLSLTSMQGSVMTKVTDQPLPMQPSADPILWSPPLLVAPQHRLVKVARVATPALPGGGGECRGCSPRCQAVAQGERSTGLRAGRPPGHQVPKALPHSWGASPVGTARRRMVNVAEGVTGPDLPERLELVRAALPDADRGRFEQELDQALDTARSTRD